MAPKDSSARKQDDTKIYKIDSMATQREKGHLHNQSLSAGNIHALHGGNQWPGLLFVLIILVFVVDCGPQFNVLSGKLTV